MKRLIGLMALCAIAGIGCGDDDGPGVDSGVDGGPIILPDGGGMDSDTPRPDAGDAGPDTGVTTTIGERCTAMRGCPGPGEDCLDESTNTVGGAGDPIEGAPAEIASGLTTSSFLDGYCIVRDCDLDAEDAGEEPCGPGASCLEAAENFGVCFADCGVPSSADNGTCRDGYDCLAGANVCLPGCTEDAECRIIREETNGVPGIQAPADCSARPADCGGTATNFDRLRWVPESESDIACDPNTFRCEFSGAAGASAGDPCEQDWDCEANGTCFADAPGTPADEAFWGEAGFCAKRGCNEAGNGCAEGGSCVNRRLGIDLCMPTCTVGAGSNPEDPSTWLGNTGGCGEGQICFWSGVAAETNNGFCLPGAENNDVTTENIGSTCEDASECWSPFGEGNCFTSLFADNDLPNGYCTVIDCGAPGRGGENSCGEGNLCVGLGSDAAPISLCFQGCETAADCQAGLGCTAITEGDAKVCFPGCSETADCRTGETCVGASATELGACE